jgi:hypothetical protein
MYPLTLEEEGIPLCGELPALVGSGACSLTSESTAEQAVLTRFPGAAGRMSALPNGHCHYRYSRNAIARSIDSAQSQQVSARHRFGTPVSV